MERKEDSRVIKTRASLRKSLLELLSLKSYDSITDNEICDRAGIRRATFYKHFADKNAFLFSVVHELREDFDKNVWSKEITEYSKYSKEYYILYAEILVRFLVLHCAVTRRILQSSCGINLIAMLMHQNNVDTQIRLGQSVENGMKLCTSINSMSTMLTGGIAFMISDWFTDNKGLSTEDLIRDIKQLIERLLD